MMTLLKLPKTQCVKLDQPPMDFLEWTLTQWQGAKESANIEQRYSAVHTPVGDTVDFVAQQGRG